MLSERQLRNWEILHRNRPQALRETQSWLNAVVDPVSDRSQVIDAINRTLGQATREQRQWLSKLTAVHEGYTLATFLVEQMQYSWLGGDQSRTYSLVRSGIDLSQPDGQGRLAPVGALIHAASRINVDELRWAFQLGGLSPLARCPTNGAVLGVDFQKCNNREYDLLHRKVQHHAREVLQQLPPPGRIEVFEQLNALIAAPHQEWWSEERAELLEVKTPKSRARKASSARRL